MNENFTKAVLSIGLPLPLQVQLQITLSLVALIYLAALGLTILDVHQSQKATQVTMGRVFEYEPQNHSRVKYEYFVNNSRYVTEGSGNISMLGKSFPLRYDPDNPAFTRGHDLPNLMQNILALSALFAGGVGCVFAAYFLVRRRRFREE